jgi:hypothetical protein
MTDTVQRAKEALWGRYHELNPHIFVDSKGYEDEGDVYKFIRF